MKRVRRWAINGMIGLSLFLCATATVFCVRSHWVFDNLDFKKTWNDEKEGAYQDWDCALASSGYQLTFEYDLEYESWSGEDSARGSTPPLLGYEIGCSHQPAKGVVLADHWFDFWRDDWSGSIRGGQGWAIALPYPALILLGSLMPGVMGWRFYRDRAKRRTGCCISCGYDLRATPRRCPECGAVPRELV